MAMAKKKAPVQSPFEKPFIKKTIGTITAMKRSKTLLTFFTPRSKLVSPRDLVDCEAMSPKKVASPVFKTSTFPWPLKTSVPIKAKFSKSSAVTVFGSRSWTSVATYFSTGSDSPVNEDWFTNKSFAQIKRASAGIISPVDRLTISPGTISSIGISWVTPSRVTEVVVSINSFKAKLACCERYSWKKCKPALKTIINPIIILAS